MTTKRKPRRKVTSNRDMRDLLDRTITGLNVVSNAAASDFENVGRHFQSFRELFADLSFRVSRLEALLSDRIPQ